MYKDNKPAKKCPHCKETYELDVGFSKNKRRKDGYQTWCKICMTTNTLVQDSFNFNSY